MITDVFRTQAEFDALYAQTPPAERPGRSPHQDWLAVDLRSTVFTDAELKRVVAFCNEFTYRAGAKPVCFAHAIAGGAYHVHVQMEST